MVEINTKFMTILWNCIYQSEKKAIFINVLLCHMQSEWQSLCIQCSYVFKTLTELFLFATQILVIKKCQ